MKQQVQSELLTPEAFQQSFSSHTNAILIDVRTPEEFQQGHLTGAQNYNIYDSLFIPNITAIDKNKPVYVYCKKGGRSTDAADQLKVLGYRHIYNLEGGYTAWKTQGLPVEK